MSADWTEMGQLVGRNFLADATTPTRTWLKEYIYQDDQALVMAAIGEGIRTKSVFELEHRVRRANGAVGWIQSRAVPLLDAQGEILEWFGAASDVTARRQAVEALRNSEARFRAAVGIVSSLIWTDSAEKNGRRATGLGKLDRADPGGIPRLWVVPGGA